MKKLILLLLLLPFLSSAQQTYVPDDNFEQLLIQGGFDNVMDDSVLTANIDTISYMNLNNSNISDLTGIEDFIDLKYLFCSNNQLTNLNISTNLNLIELRVHNNQIISLNTSNNINLIELHCGGNNLSILDISANIALEELTCSANPLTNLILNDTSLLYLSCSGTSLTTIDLGNNVNLNLAYITNGNLSNLNLNGADNLNILDVHENNLTSIDISTNINLEILYAVNNNLSSLDLRNGNNSNNLFLQVKQNPNLTCISVDDTTWANANWNTNNIDPQHYFSNNCDATNIREVKESKQILRIVDILGRETQPKKNTPLFYLYDDGTVGKKIFFE